MIDQNGIEYSIFLIFVGAALLATLALYARQAMIVGYIFLGIILGPWGFSLVNDPVLIKDISQIGIIFLLFLLGLDLLPQQLLQMLGEALKITILSSIAFAVTGIATGIVFGYPLNDIFVIGAVMMFSSTIIGLKLLPTTTLHHRHTGQIIISVLLIQDLIAIVILLLIQGYSGGGENLYIDIIRQLLGLPTIIAIAWFLERYVLIRLLQKFDQIHEYIFLLAIAWCMGIAELAASLGLSHEIGAFIAGVTLASSPIALFITDKLKPLRDFFLIIFFFSLGATFNVQSVPEIIVPAIVLALFVIIFKPVIITVLLNKAGEKKSVSREVGFRLGQISEFSLLISVLALEAGLITGKTSNLIQLTTLLTFIISSYIIVKNYPTPIGVTDKLRRD